MTKSTIQFVTPPEQLPLCKQAEQVLQQHVTSYEVNSGGDALEAHIAKMSIANSSGALKRQFHNIVTEK
jgi:hypothetical protein